MATPASTATYAKTNLTGSAAPRRWEVARPSGRNALRAALRAVADAEGPVLADVACRRVLGAWGMAPSAGRVAALLASGHGRPQSADSGQPVLWPAGAVPACAVPFRAAPGGTRRTCHEVPMPELVGLARSVTGVDPRSRMRAMADALGGATLAGRTFARLELAVRVASALGADDGAAHAGTGARRSP